MKIVPLTLAQANELVAKLHRHHKPRHGHRFSIGLVDGDALIGAAICGRPVARNTDQFKVLEVLRLVTDGSKNACSALYSACARIAREMGFEKIQTFILDSEPGVSLKAAGWTCEHLSEGGSWVRASRPNCREDQPQCPKQRWAKVLFTHP